ncbi:hypothetical protein MARCHEWKA_02650 [Brevundimonas phage vB_BpoS-Marchewka]|uniref:Uncharacterized protein n=1 Tax=Brevundimonas phage vB_BpoS-Marchewka TaxID=2948604 RepID=A0A9E7STV7_9CAUD|nr:hypothetical protein MARCHEWKA_02650 [Brevundimonas phage vB_BpoS-Marchewka]
MEEFNIEVPLDTVLTARGRQIADGVLRHWPKSKAA